MFSTLNIAVLTPIPSASVITAVAANPGVAVDAKLPRERFQRRSFRPISGDDVLAAIVTGPVRGERAQRHVESLPAHESPDTQQQLVARQVKRSAKRRDLDGNRRIEQPEQPNAGNHLRLVE